MREFGLTVAATIVTAAVLFAPAATAQWPPYCKGEPPDLVIVIYPETVREQASCVGKERSVCLDWYWECNSQPFPIDDRRERGHLAEPRMALLARTDLPNDPHLPFLSDVHPDAPASCERGSLFERMDRRRQPDRRDEVTRELGPTITSVALAAP